MKERLAAMTPEAARLLAEAALLERFERLTVVGHTESGRVIVEHGPLGPASEFWFALRAEAEEGRS